MGFGKGWEGRGGGGGGGGEEEEKEKGLPLLDVPASYSLCISCALEDSCHHEGCMPS